jgi:nucleoside 2-deoxyribosyltransferase
MPRTIYQAGPLFSRAEHAFHRELSARLREAGHEVVWPGDLLTEAQIEAAGPYAPQRIYTACRDALDSCNCVVALLDGTQVDDGTAWEIGYACAKGIPIYGMRTDIRCAGETPYSYVNSMIQGCLAGFARNLEALVGMLECGKVAQKEDECPCLDDDCPRRGNCFSCYMGEASVENLPSCMRPENAASKELIARVNARLRAFGMQLGDSVE